MIPPPLAVLLGTAGAKTKSANPKPYARPRELFPNILINKKAILFPKPVLINPLAIKNEIPISQITLSPKPLNIIKNKAHF